MMRGNSCPKCQSSISQGFVVDRDTSSGARVASWIEGAPEKSKWFGLKLGKRPSYEIQTWRCGAAAFWKTTRVAEASRRCLVLLAAGVGAVASLLIPFELLRPPGFPIGGFAFRAQSLASLAA